MILMGLFLYIKIKIYYHIILLNCVIFPIDSIRDQKNY